MVLNSVAIGTPSTDTKSQTVTFKGSRPICDPTARKNRGGKKNVFFFVNIFPFLSTFSRSYYFQNLVNSILFQ